MTNAARKISMPDTALAGAFVRAGISRDDPWERLLDIAKQAWTKWSTADAGGARRDYVTSHLVYEMTWALVSKLNPSGRVQLIGQLLNEAKRQIEDERPIRDAGHKPAGGGQLPLDAHRSVAPANPFRDAGHPAGDGHNDRDSPVAPAVTASFRDHAKPQAERGSESASGWASPKIIPPTAPNLTALADKQAAAGRARAGNIAELCRLDTVMIGARAIGDCTVAEVRLWAEQRAADQRAAGRDVRFALSLIGANLGSNEIIRKWVRPDEADEIYNRAEAEHAP